MAKSLKIRFTTNGQSSYKGKLCLEISKQGTTQRAYIPVQSLKGVDLTDWHEDKHHQLFLGLSAGAQRCNSLLTQMKDSISLLLDNKDLHFETPQELKHAFITGETILAKEDKTFGELVADIVKDEKEKQTNKSTNYQTYINLLHKLTSSDAPKYNGENISDIPVSQISDNHFKAFSNWLLEKHPQYGYKNLMKTFHAALTRAKDKYELDTNPLTFKFMKYAPQKDTTTENMSAKARLACAENDIVTFSLEQLETFLKFDLTKIEPRQKEFKKYLRVYIDTCLLMYYTFSRPADVIRWTWENNYEPSTQTITYTAWKKRNKKGTRSTVVRLNSKAIEIINKYKGQSKGGYLLPLPMNETNWKEKGVEGYSSWEICRKNTIQSINHYLALIAKEMKLELPKFTMYVFRHSAITHAINDFNINSSVVARWAATSTKMIDKHYLSRVNNSIANPL